MRKHSDDRQSKEYRLLKFRYKLLMQYGPTVDIETYRFDSILGSTVSIKPFWMRFFPSAGYERGCDNFKDPGIMEKRIP